GVKATFIGAFRSYHSGMRLLRILPLTALLLIVASRPSFADATLFIGTNTAPSSHATKGFAIGATLLIIGVEFEYASAGEDTFKAVPSLRTGMGNVYVQTPVPIAGFRFYATTGAGLYREKLEPTHQETNFGFNTGGGAKLSLLGPLSARFDYRLFK